MSSHEILSRNKSRIDKLSYLNFAAEEQQGIIFKVSKSVFHSISGFRIMIMGGGVRGETFIFSHIHSISKA